MRPSYSDPGTGRDVQDDSQDPECRRQEVRTSVFLPRRIRPSRDPYVAVPRNLKTTRSGLTRTPNYLPTPGRTLSRSVVPYGSLVGVPQGSQPHVLWTRRGRTDVGGYRPLKGWWFVFRLNCPAEVVTTLLPRNTGPLDSDPPSGPVHLRIDRRESLRDGGPRVGLGDGSAVVPLGQFRGVPGGSLPP